MGTSGGVPEMQPGNGSAVNPDMAAMRAVYNRHFGFRYRSAVAAVSGKLRSPVAHLCFQIQNPSPEHNGMGT